MAPSPSPPPNGSAAAESPSALRLPVVPALQEVPPGEALRSRLAPEHLPLHAFGRLETLALQLHRIRPAGPDETGEPRLHQPQLLVFAGDHGLSDERVSRFPQSSTRAHVRQMLYGRTVVNDLARQHGFELTVVDAGVASHVLDAGDDRPAVPFLLRKIGYGTRNMLLGPAMSTAQTTAALHAGMDVVKRLPGRVLAVGDIGVANTACAALLLSRLCGVPLADACGQGSGLDDAGFKHKVETLLSAAARHRKATSALDVLASLGGFEIAMMVGAMLQAASERRVVLLDGYVAGAAALVARKLAPAVTDFLVCSHRSTEPGHRLLLIHLQAQPLLDLELRVGHGAGALLAWPLLQAAATLLTLPDAG